MELQAILFSQGFGTRRVCAGLVQQGHVAVFESADAREPRPCLDASAYFDPNGLRFRVRGEDWCYADKAYLMMNKPAGTECSHKPSAHPSVYSLLPSPLRQRPQKGGLQGVQAVGRLDQDTTGLLLLTDDGQFLHRMNSPKHHTPKVYAVTLRHPAQTSQLDALLQGVVLDDDPRPVRAQACVQVSERQLHLTLTQGKYHQVKRMIAAVGNRVEALHRFQTGALCLPDDLQTGQWRWLSAAEVVLASSASPAQSTESD